MSRSGASVDGGTNGFERARLRFFRYRAAAGTAQKAGLALSFAAVTGLAAQVRVPLPFTPVPITLQTFAVLLTGVVLGARWGGASQGLYAILGAAGVPWFTGTAGGLGQILGPTGGYIVGFVLAAAVVGYVTDRYLKARRFAALVAVLAVANFGVIYGVGLPWLYAWLATTSGAPSLVKLLELGLVPFVPGDVVKLLAAAGVATAVVPKEPFGTERDEEAVTRTE